MSALYSWIDRFVRREAEFDGADGISHLRAFLFIGLIAYGMEGLYHAMESWGHWIPSNALEALAVPILIAICAFTPYRRAACGVLCAVILFRLVTTFPEGANHTYLFAITFGLFAMCRTEVEEERAWLLGALKLLFLLILFYSGLQKLLHGYYERGEFFAIHIAGTEWFRSFFALFLPATDIERLASYRPEPGAGPFRLHSTLGILISRGSYTLEMIFPFFFLVRQTRAIAVAGAIVLMAMIESLAREFTFGLYFINMALLFGSGPIHWRLRWGAVLVGVIVVTLGLLEMLGVVPDIHLK